MWLSILPEMETTLDFMHVCITKAFSACSQISSELIALDVHVHVSRPSAPHIITVNQFIVLVVLIDPVYNQVFAHERIC